MAGSEQPTVVPEGPHTEEEVKLNFRNIFTFFSSLDYLRFLELEGAFEDMRSGELYYVGERAALITFILKKVVPSLTLIYLIFLIVLSYFYGWNPLIVSLVLTAFYVFLSFLLVERYTIGGGYLYLVFRDFLLNTLILTFVSWILGDILIFYVLPRLWELFLEWYLNVEGRFSYMVAKIVYTVLNPLFNRAVEFVYPYVQVYLFTSPVKAFSLAGVYLYFVWLSRRRRNRLVYRMERLRKRS